MYSVSNGALVKDRMSFAEGGDSLMYCCMVDVECINGTVLILVDFNLGCPIYF